MMDNIPIATPDGYFVSQEHLRIAEIIKDYDPRLRLVFIPPSQRNSDDPNEKPFAVADFPDDKEPYIVFFADECDERIIERLFQNDLQKHDVVGRVNAADAAREAIKLKKEVEQQEELEDMARSMWRSPLHTYKHNGKKLRT